ncbi:MAG: hypothetical protein Q9219_005869 [cf. Caloplaca sp. 3 TL-2023]
MAVRRVTLRRKFKEATAANRANPAAANQTRLEQAKKEYRRFEQGRKALKKSGPSRTDSKRKAELKADKAKEAVDTARTIAAEAQTVADAAVKELEKVLGTRYENDAANRAHKARGEQWAAQDKLDEAERKASKEAADWAKEQIGIAKSAAKKAAYIAAEAEALRS